MANNPYNNKIIYGDTVLIDLTEDTVTSENLRSGYTAHDKSGEVITGSIPDQPSVTITPNRSAQIAVTAGKYTTGIIEVAPIPSDYHLLTEIFPVDSFYASLSGTDPSTTLGFGTWELVRSSPYRWADVASLNWQEVYDDDWSFSDKVVDNIYVYKRIS